MKAKNPAEYIQDKYMNNDDKEPIFPICVLAKLINEYLKGASIYQLHKWMKENGYEIIGRIDKNATP